MTRYKSEMSFKHFYDSIIAILQNSNIKVMKVLAAFTRTKLLSKVFHE